MAKKKPVNDAFEDVNIEINTPDSDDKINASKPKDIPEIDTSKYAVNMMLTADMKKKLDEYESTVEQNSTLVKQNDELMQKISEYVEEVAELKKTAFKPADDSAELKDLKSKYGKLENEYKKLQTASDEYLMRISELTFENAKLNASLENLKSKTTTISPNVNTPSSPSRIQRNGLEHPVYDPYKQNGYASWN